MNLWRRFEGPFKHIKIKVNISWSTLMSWLEKIAAGYNTNDDVSPPPTIPPDNPLDPPDDNTNTVTWISLDGEDVEVWHVPAVTPPVPLNPYKKTGRG